MMTGKRVPAVASFTSIDDELLSAAFSSTIQISYSSPVCLFVQETFSCDQKLWKEVKERPAKWEQKQCIWAHLFAPGGKWYSPEIQAT